MWIKHWSLYQPFKSSQLLSFKEIKKDYRPSFNTLVNMSKRFFLPIFIQDLLFKLSAIKINKILSNHFGGIHLFWSRNVYKTLDNLIKDDLFFLFFLCCLFTLFFSFSFSKSSSFSNSLNQRKISKIASNIVLKFKHNYQYFKWQV